MALVDEVSALLGEGAIASFRLSGEDLAVLPPARLLAAAADYREQLERSVPPDLVVRFEEEQADVLRVAHRWLRRYNRSLEGRVRGYLELGRRCRFAYPWPVVAILGIAQVSTGLSRNRVMGLVGRQARRAGFPLLDRLVDATDDVLRRTNRGIFADSVPVVLYGLRCRELRERGERALAGALIEGPLPPLMDPECRALFSSLVGGLERAPGAGRFRALSELTLRHFAREQAVFSFHMGAAERPDRPVPALVRRLTRLESVPAPRIEGRGERRRIVFRPYRLPPGFEMTDHVARVEVFGRAFVSSLTSSVDDYRVAVRHVVRSFGTPGEQPRTDYDDHSSLRRS